MNRLQNALEINHERACEINGYLTDPFYTPDGMKVQIAAKILEREHIRRHLFKMIKIDD